jgi:hypothetical protein
MIWVLDLKYHFLPQDHPIEIGEKLHNGTGD